MIKLWVVFLMVVGIAVSTQTPSTTDTVSTTNKMNNSTGTNNYTSTVSTVSTVPTTPTSGTGTGGFRLHSFNLLFLPLTITASVFYLSC